MSLSTKHTTEIDIAQVLIMKSRNSIMALAYIELNQAHRSELIY